MLTPDYLEHCADDVIEVYQQLDESIARDIARRFIRMGEISDTSRWQAEQLQHAGALQDDIIRSVAQYSGTAEDEIRTAFTDAGVETVETDMELYHRSGTVDPDLTISMTERASNVLSANLQKINTSNIDVCVRSMRNLTLTTAVASQQRFIEAASLASLQVNSGLMSYQQAIRNAIVDAASQGATVLYPSGHVDKLDVAVRRAVVTGVNQTSGKITETLADEFECDLMEITAHFGARPSHAEWQGQIVSRSGRHGYLSLSDIGYGTGDGFQGWNCRHSWNPFFEGISTRAWTDEQLQHLNDKDVTYNDKQYTQYEMSQMMRSAERGIRSTKRELAALDEAIKNTDDPAIKAECQKAFDEKSMELSKQKNKYKDLCNADGNLNSPNKSRTDVYGFGRSTSARTTGAVRRINNEKIHFLLDNAPNSDIIKSQGIALSSFFINSSDQLLNNIKLVKSIDGFEDLAIHGSATGFSFRDKNGDDHHLTPREFAEVLKQTPSYKGGNIRLLSCETGANDGIAAPALARQMNVKVLAPSNTLWVNGYGELSIGDTDQENTGTWKLYDENGVVINEDYKF